MQPIAIRLGASLTSGCAEQSGDLLRLAFGYGTTENNGNILTQDISRDAAGFSSSQSYTYDGLNRLRSIAEGSGAQTFVYDRYGNRAVLDSSYIPIAAQTPVVSSDTEAAVTAIFPSNRWSGGTHDNAGNQTARYGGSFAYDAENRVTSSTVGSVTTTYAYDGEGRRVKKDAVVMVYDAFGKLAAEYGGTPSATGRQYLTADHLGSTRLVTNATGGEQRCSDYLPFGEEIPQGINSRGTCYATFNDPRQKFTGKERDGETGLDYFGARYMSAAQGRFTSPDKPFADQFPENPQSWNLYSYTRNNPLLYIDDDGRGAKEFFFGLTNAVSSNAWATQRVRSSHPDVQLGQRLGDGLSMVGGFIEMAGGTTMTGGGAGACATGVLCVAGAPAMAAGVTIAGHGAMLTGNGLANFMTASDDEAGSSGRQQQPQADKPPELVTNPKHHPNSQSPQPANAQDLFKASVADKNGVRWAKDADGAIHRFSAPSNGQAHWNGSTAGKKSIRTEDIPIEIRRRFQ